MNEPNLRYEPSQGGAFEEASDMQRLSTLAAEGWRLIGFKGLRYVLEPAPPEQLIFALDYMYEPDEVYIALCRASGWERVVTMDGMIPSPSTVACAGDCEHGCDGTCMVGDGAVGATVARTA